MKTQSQHIRFLYQQRGPFIILLLLLLRSRYLPSEKHRRFLLSVLLWLSRMGSKCFLPAFGVHLRCVYCVHTSMDHLGKTTECPILSCQIVSHVHGRAYDYFFIFIFLAASVSGPRNYLEMDRGIMYD